MVSQERKRVCIALALGMGCLSLATLHAQTMGATNSAVVYNDQGDITSDSQSSQYRYNPLNQLTHDQAIKSEKTINYRYYATGMQASESVVASGLSNTVATILYHYYAGQGQLLNSVQDDNFSGYLLANGMALRSYQHANTPQVQTYIRNRHSSVITTISNKTTKTQQYNSYGALNGTSSLAKKQEVYGISTNPLRYSNYPFDVLADIYYLKARYYTPIYRSFLSRDSYNLANRYYYGNANPIIGSDLNGHMFTFEYRSDAFPNITKELLDTLSKLDFRNRKLISETLFSSESLPEAIQNKKLTIFQMFNKDTITFQGKGKNSNITLSDKDFLSLLTHQEDGAYQDFFAKAETKITQHIASIINSMLESPVFQCNFFANSEKIVQKSFPTTLMYYDLRYENIPHGKLWLEWHADIQRDEFNLVPSRINLLGYKRAPVANDFFITEEGVNEWASTMNKYQQALAIEQQENLQKEYESAFKENKTGLANHYFRQLHFSL